MQHTMAHLPTNGHPELVEGSDLRAHPGSAGASPSKHRNRACWYNWRVRLPPNRTRPRISSLAPSGNPGAGACLRAPRFTHGCVSRIAMVPLLALLITQASLAQSVNVTVELDRTTLVPGLETTLRVFGQIDDAITNQSEQLFSWYVDVLNSDGTVATAQYAGMVTTNCDNLAQTSSSGTPDGDSRRGIYNTLMNHSGAGKSNAIELLSIPVAAVGTGTVSFSVQAGTTVAALAHDFIVATTNQVDPFTGGNYTAAQASLTVVSPPKAAIQPIGGGLEITFDSQTGLEYTVDAKSSLLDPDWLPLPGGPHNLGTLVDSDPSPTRFYRISVR